jgi:superfamily I DNA/RNA helicase
MPTIARLIGGAGTGKTTELLSIMAKTIDAGVDPMHLGFVSFTRAARGEAAERAAKQFGLQQSDLEREGWFRTLHSVCYRCLGDSRGELLTGGKAGRQWLQNALQTDVGAIDDAEGQDFAESFGEGQTEGGMALRLWSAARSRLEPLQEVWQEAAEIDERTPDWATVQSIVERYELHKRLDHRSDFVDLAGLFAGWRFGIEAHDEITPQGEVPQLPVWFFDEQQDTSRLLDSVCRRLIGTEACQWVYVCGDPFQCQPAGTVVRTVAGDRRIEDLSEDDDRLICYDRNDGELRGWQSGYRFKKASRRFSGELITIKAESESRCTPNHKWMVRWCDRNPATNIVYLMRQGDRFRIGWCQLFRKDGWFHLGTRARCERADEAWILATFDNRPDGSAYESYVAAQFGLPMLPFYPINNSEVYTKETIDKAFSRLNPAEQRERAERCLAAHGRELKFPIWSRGACEKQGKRTCQTVQACNLIAGLMAVLQVHGKQAEWTPITSINRQFCEIDVWSLEVEKHQNYIADGLVTCNSIYGWAGANAECFREWEATKERTMPRSYRCPAAILEAGETVLRECSDYFDRGIAPAEHDGTVDFQWWNSGVPRGIDPQDSWLLLARTNRLANQLATALDREGLPWVPTKGLGGWAAPKRNAAFTAFLALQRGVPIGSDEWRAAIDLIPVKTDAGALLERGVKTQWGDKQYKPSADLAALDQLADWGATEALCQVIRTGEWRSIVEGGERFADAVDRWGYDAVIQPKIRVGTIHSVKGAEADNVLLLTTSTHQCDRAMQNERMANEERRVSYVGITRARHRLIIAKERNARFRMSL